MCIIVLLSSFQSDYHADVSVFVSDDGFVCFSLLSHFSLLLRCISISIRPATVIVSMATQSTITVSPDGRYIAAQVHQIMAVVEQR